VTNNTTTSSAAATAAGVDPLANEQTFMQLLVAQMQNQDPMSPTDPTQMVSELTQFSQLEQQIGINQNTATLVTDASPAAAANTPTANSIATHAAALQ
jgi:flagellar basal-body rod modification protein FlgD